jgi:hypothetical protein
MCYTSGAVVKEKEREENKVGKFGFEIKLYPLSQHLLPEWIRACLIRLFWSDRSKKVVFNG